MSNNLNTRIAQLAKEAYYGTLRGGTPVTLEWLYTKFTVAASVGAEVEREVCETIIEEQWRHREPSWTKALKAIRARGYR